MTDQPDEDDTVVPLQCPIAVYKNVSGGVTIEQDQTGQHGEMVRVSINSKHAVRAVIAALRRQLGGF